MRVEVVVEGNACPMIGEGLFKDRNILGVRHSDFGNMNCVQTAIWQDLRCARSEPLIQQNADHATMSVTIRSSSTVAAA